MATRVNKKFVIALSAAILLLVGGFLVVLIKLNKTASDYEEVADRAVAEAKQELAKPDADTEKANSLLNRAVSNYVSAKNEDPTNTRYFYKFIEAHELVVCDEMTMASNELLDIFKGAYAIHNTPGSSEADRQLPYQVLMDRTRMGLIVNGSSPLGEMRSIASKRLDAYPDDMLALKHKVLVDVYLIQSQTKQAELDQMLTDLDRVAQAFPEDPVAHNARARFHINNASRLFSDAGKQFTQPVQRQFMLAYDELKASRAMAPDDPANMVQVMKLIQNLRSPDEAVAKELIAAQIDIARHLSTLLEDKANRDKLFTEELNDVVTFLAQMGSGIEGHAIDGPALSLALAEQIAADRAEEPAVYAILGGQQNRRGDAEKAVQTLEKGLAIDRRTNALTYIRDQEARADMLSQLAEAKVKFALSSAADEQQRSVLLREAGESIKAYRDAESMRPRAQEARAHFLAGQLEFVRNRPDQALRSFERANEIEGGNLDTLLLLARTHTRLNNTGSAIRFYQQALEIRPQLPDRLQMIQLLLSQNDRASLSRAGAQINAYLTDFPDNIQAIQLKADLLSRDGKHEEAAALLAQLNPASNPVIMINLARYKAQAGEVDEAVAMLRDWLMNLPEGEMMDLRGVQTLLSLLPTREEQLAELTRLEQTGRIAPESMQPLRMVYEGQGRLTMEDEIKLLEAKNLPPADHAIAMFMIGRRWGELESADQWLKQAITLAPKDPRVIEWRFRTALADERWADADRAIDDMMALDPVDRPTIAITDGAFMRAMALAARGNAAPAGEQRDRALSDATLAYQRALDKDRNYVQGWVQLGQVQILRSNNFAAQQSLGQALERQPNNLLALQLMAQAELATGEQTRALSRYEQVLRIQPNNFAVLDQYSDLARQLGTPARAIRQREAIRDQFPDNTRNRRALAMLYSDDLSYGKALDEVQAIIKLEGKTRANLEVLARVHVGGKKPDLAVTAVADYLAERGDQADTADHLLMAQTLELAEQNDNAEAAYLRAIELEQADAPLASLAWGQALQARGETRRAAAVYERLIAQLPDNDALKMQTAQVYLRVPDPAKAEQIAQALPPSADRAMLLIETASRTEGHLGVAIQRARDAVKLYPSNISVRMLLTQLILAQQERRPAENRDYAEVKRLAEQMVKDYPDRVDAQLVLAQIESFTEQTPAAIARLEKVLETTPGYLPANERLYEILLAQARGLAETSREESRVLAGQALGVMAALLKARPENAEYQRGAGDAASLTGRNEQAVGYYAKAFELSQSPNDLAAYVGSLLAVGRGIDANAVLDANPGMVNQNPYLKSMRGRALAASDQKDLAENLFGNILGEADNEQLRVLIVRQITAAFASEPDRAVRIIEGKLGTDLPLELDTILAAMLMGQKRHADAAARLAEHNQNPPANPRAHFTLIMQLALTHQEAGQLVESKRVYEDGLRLIDANAGLIPVRDQVRMLNNLAYLLADRMEGYESQAVTYAQRALDLLPKTETKENVALIEDTLGWTLYKAGRTDEAIRTLNSSVAKYELSANLMHLGAAYLAKDDKNSALLTLDRARRLAVAAKDDETVRQIDELRRQAL